ncbi:cardiolipin synthase [Geobacillus sp. NFOSA3]|uniref:Cardiolipin synthase n=5 Tax=Anoxybacillaceae TaxID=3120669 RepID=CLS_GEOSW|nr:MULTISPECIES: cardiolipin synthase [Parageobacillus]C5D794.1 RecName: Full=Cardiolipin synthase; Short=CL synthase [Geobacillus sp. WCH70]NNU93614.1 cardiolipin synthase [Geobacillus sp. NFOSA3]OQO99095.1 cardiolipin synthase [Geobacillus sp. 44C]MBB3868223.1 cardiolipin synthase [Parageobacillus toebii NBRC 107807]MED4989978.1 cardiolipin synthase [Parageobacillus toebii]OXB94183.1 cardiolipin synthase [Parageobacillus galactosidasius]
MRNTLRVIIFVLAVAAFLFLTNDYWEGKLLGGLSILISCSVVFIAFVISLENRKPAHTITWLVVLGSFPLIGFFFYLMFGRNYRKQRLFQKKAMLDEQTFLKFQGQREWAIEQMPIGEHQRPLLQLAHRIGKSPVSLATETRVLTNGEETFSTIFEELEKATHHIHLEYYIVRHDEVGQKLKTILIEKAKKGVHVRFLYDAVGSWKLSKTYIQELRDAGVEMIPFSPVRLPFLSNTINFRNHRKIIVIDGTIGFVGGLNIGDEYLGKDKYFGFWRDTHLWIRGEAVRTLQLIFLQDWYYMTGKTLLTPEYLSPELVHYDGQGGVQLIAGGPDQKWEVIKHLYFAMITSAQRSIWIASPYFVPDEDILTALKIAALSGLDVRILAPKRPDKKIVFYASRSYFPELLEAGVKIYEYSKGFLHSKIMIVDGELASIGTANMDMRSFHLNFEVNAFLYHTDSTKKLVADFLEDLKEASPIDYETFQQRPLSIRVVESVSRLLSPLL